MTLDRDEILERLRSIAPDRVGVDPELLRPAAALSEIGIDSYLLIELVFVAEEEFGVKIPTEGFEVKTVADVIAIIEQQLQRTPSPAG